VDRNKVLARLAILLFASVLSAQTEHHPKLIVVIIVDQMRADYLDRFAPYEDGGLHFLATEGADFLNANYQHSPTETCVGHSVLLSGRNPARTGIVANEWYDRGAGRMTYCIDDASSPVVGGSGNAVSPKNFIGENFSDWLQGAYPGSRVYSISLKDRAAVLLGGHRPQGVFWFSHESGRFVTGRYSASQLPPWVEQFDQKHIADSYAGKTWTPLLDKESPAYRTHEVAPQFPHPMPDEAGLKLYDSVYGSPFGDEVLEAFAEATMTANHLGEQPTPDLLAVSFSSNDAVGHSYGPDSPEIADEQIRLDRILGRLVEFIDRKLGKENVLWVLSADHGSEPAPEAEQELNHNPAARRLPFSDAQHSAEEQLNAIFHLSGEMHWFAAQTDTMLYFDRGALARQNITLEAARHALATEVHDVPGMEGFYDATQLTTVPGWIGTFLRNSNFPGRSGDVYYLTKQWTFFSSRPTGTSHGDPWPYDTHVPFVIAGWRIQPKRIAAEIHVADLAPTLADLVDLRLPASEAIDGESLSKLLKLAKEVKAPPNTALGR
jgi:hypothetical protein